MHRAHRGKFRIIYADPPWTYRDKATAGDRGLANKYETMSLRQIVELPIAQLAAPDAVAFVWATLPLLAEGLDVLRGWGFEYKTAAFVWVKRTATGKLHWGMGNTTRANAEIVLYGRRGKGVKRVSGGVHSVIESPIGKHSAKPAECRNRIHELYGDRRRIELFAREAVPGWHRWGLEAPGGSGCIPLGALG